MRALMAGILLGVAFMPSRPVQALPAVAMTGGPAPGLEVFDQTMASLMSKWQIPGASLAVVKDGRLVLAHGYGMADVDAGTPAQPDSLFPSCSLTKEYTATAGSC